MKELCGQKPCGKRVAAIDDSKQGPEKYLNGRILAWYAEDMDLISRTLGRKIKEKKKTSEAALWTDVQRKVYLQGGQESYKSFP